ncbi:MAG TPA: phosphoribosylanthranilate isomerase [Chthoniobacter sp.]|nr:phosphoribosylanthranilate isomerase [Chthoniobacter sp.]
MNPSRVRIKICGVTNEEDARMATAWGADALGFNLWPGSKRCIDLDRAFSWIRGLPPLVTRVAVLVNVSLKEARDIAAHPAIDLVQFHGDEDESYCAQFAACGRPFIKALRIRDSSSLDHLDRYSTPSILLDADAGAAYGGTGRQLAPALAAEAVLRFPEIKVILAGGLKPENVAEAVRIVQPYAVDVASGVEKSPGQKDAEKVERFFASLR